MKRLFLTVVFIALILQGYAQSAVEYLKTINAQYEQIQQDTWDFAKSIAKGKKAATVEKRRNELIATINTAIQNVSKLRPYNGNPNLKNSTLQYLKMQQIILKEDYGKLVDLEAIAEQSYDKMEAYIMAKELANKKLDIAFDTMAKAYQQFAKDNQITLVEGEKDRITKKLAEASKLFKYYNQMYLIMFKSYKQDAHLFEAISKADIGNIEKNKEILNSLSKEALARLDTMSNFQNDDLLKKGCRQLLEMYRNQTENEINAIVDFYLKKEKFEKLKATIEAKKPAQRTRQEVDNYNAAVADYNAAILRHNELIALLNKKRNQALKEWNDSVEKFFSRYIP